MGEGREEGPHESIDIWYLTLYFSWHTFGGRYRGLDAGVSRSHKEVNPGCSRLERSHEIPRNLKSPTRFMGV